MRAVAKFEFTLDGAEIVAIDSNGDLWYADWTPDLPRVLEWHPLNGPPDGAHLQDRLKSRWERIEQEARDRIAASEAIDAELEGS